MKKIFALLIALMMLCMLAVPAVSAADMTQGDYIYFQIPNTTGVRWGNFSMVYCHIWKSGGDPIYGWQDKNERCEDCGNGYWRYDISEIEFDPTSTYAVIFSNDIGLQTYDLYITSACKGDIAVCNGDTSTNPMDSERKSDAVARWMTAGKAVPPVAQIGSDGAMLNPDGIDTDDLDVRWGESEGVSVEMPEIAIDTDDADETEEDADTVADADSEPGLSMITVWIIVICAVIFVAVVVIVIVLARKNLKKK